MAKSRISWTRVENVLTTTVAKEKAINFDMTLIFPDFGKFNDVQQGCIINGAKQKLADNLARPKDERLTDKECYDALTALWNRLVAKDATWNAQGGKGDGITKKVLAEKLAAQGIELTEALALIAKLSAK